MFNVCQECGVYAAAKQVDPAGPDAICPACGRRHRFRSLPLLLVGGASGSGKSTVCTLLTSAPSDVVVLDADILWAADFNTPDDHYRRFFETWLRVAKNIGQSGRPVLLLGAGFCVPENVAPCVEARYFAAIHYLALTADDDLLAARLRQRPTWRDAGGAEFIAAQVRFNQWLRAAPAAGEPLQTVDTSHASPTATAAAVRAWAAACCAG